MTRNSVFLILFILGIIIACSNKNFFDEYQSIENRNWNYNNKIKFEFQINDTISKHNIYVNIRNTNDYSFKNLNLLTELYLANKTTIIDSLSYRMIDDQGYLKGDGFYILENKILYKSDFKFPQKGIYKIYLNHIMHNPKLNTQIKDLEGISDVGVSIEKITENDR